MNDSRQRIFANIRSARAFLYATRGGVLAVNFLSGIMIAIPVYFLGRSSLPGGAVDHLIVRLLQAKLLLAQAGALRVSPGWTLLPYVAAVAGSAGVCTFVRSTRLIALLNGALAAAIVGVFALVSTVLPFPAGPLAVILLVTTGAILDDLIERRSRRRRARALEDRQQAEFRVLRHIAHSVNPTIQVAMSPLSAARDFLREHGQLDGRIARRRDGTGETVGDALDTAIISLQQIRDVLGDTEHIFGDRVREEEFEEVGLRELFESEILPLHAGKAFGIRVDIPDGIRLRLHRTLFVQAIRNLLRNAEVHGFPDSFRPAELPEVRFEARAGIREVAIDCVNNGAPFPAGFTLKDFLAFGKKGKSSPGKGLGGAWIGKFVEVHGGDFRKLSNDPVHFRITIPTRRSW